MSKKIKEVDSVFDFGLLVDSTIEKCDNIKNPKNIRAISAALELAFQAGKEAGQLAHNRPIDLSSIK